MAGPHQLRKGSSPFLDEIEDVASGLEATTLSRIDNGSQGLLDFELPYFEEEAIARLRFAGISPGLMHEAHTKKTDWEKWRRYWVDAARDYLKYSTDGPDNASVTFAAAEALTRLSDLRYAIGAGQTEKAAALAMLSLCWVFIGGTSIRFAAAAKMAGSFSAAQRSRAKKVRAKVHTEDGPTLKRDLIRRAMNSAGPDARTPEIMNHLYALLDELWLSPYENDNGEERRRVISAVDSNGKTIEFSARTVQQYAKELRGAAVTKGRPTATPIKRK